MIKPFDFVDTLHISEVACPWGENAPPVDTQAAIQTTGPVQRGRSLPRCLYFSVVRLRLLPSAPSARRLFTHNSQNFVQHYSVVSNLDPASAWQTCHLRHRDNSGTSFFSYNFVTHTHTHTIFTQIVFYHFFHFFLRVRFFLDAYLV